jgi:hypothetical protein
MGKPRFFSTQELQERTLSFIRNLSVSSELTGRYRYAPSQTEPVLYASIYAVLLYHLYYRLGQFVTRYKNGMVGLPAISSKHDDGLFTDQAIDCPLASEADWWGWRHLTLHVLMALSDLGGTAQEPFRLLDSIRTQEIWRTGWRAATGRRPQPA